MITSKTIFMFISGDEYYCSFCKGVSNQNKDQKAIFPRDTPGLTLKLLDCYITDDHLACRMFWQQLKFILSFKLIEACCTDRVKAIILDINFVDAIK